MVSAQHSTSSKADDDSPIVYVVDDDEGMRTALRNLLRSVGFAVETFGSVRDFLDFQRKAVPSCLILDVRLPGMQLFMERTSRCRAKAVWRFSRI